MSIKVVAFDADDTLWVNEPFLTKRKENFALYWKIICPTTRFLKSYIGCKFKICRCTGMELRASF